MSQLERQQQILEVLNGLAPNRSISVKELASKIFSSTSSVRRDVIILERAGLVRHEYGGVMRASFKNEVVPVRVRDDLNAQKKEQIAREAAAMVRDGDVLFLDSSSTAFRILPYLQERKGLKIITNNQKVFEGDWGLDAELYCVGGRYNPRNRNYIGGEAEEYIRRKRADICFFSSQGLSVEGAITDSSVEETSLRKAMLEWAKRRVFLCDASKIGVEKFTVLCQLSEVTDVVCDDPKKILEIQNR